MSMELGVGREAANRQGGLQKLRRGRWLCLMDVRKQSPFHAVCMVAKGPPTFVSLNSLNSVVEIGTFVSGLPVRKLKFLHH